MLGVQLGPELETHLAAIAARVGQAPSELAKRAVLAYLEDLEDYASAVDAWNEFDAGDTVTLDELMTRYGVEG